MRTTHACKHLNTGIKTERWEDKKSGLLKKWIILKWVFNQAMSVNYISFAAVTQIQLLHNNFNSLYETEQPNRTKLYEFTKVFFFLYYIIFVV